MEDDNEEFGGCLILVLLVGIFVGGISGFVTGSGSVETSEPITPELKLHIVNNKIDTTYIYKK